MFTSYWKLALAMLVMMPMQILIYFLLNRANRRTQRLLMEHSADLESQLVESVRAAGTIRRFSLEEFVNLKTESHFIRLLRTGYTASVNVLRAENASSFVSSLFTILRSEEHTSELQSLMRISYAVFCLKTTNN